jgi:hypothetical protein
MRMSKGHNDESVGVIDYDSVKKSISSDRRCLIPRYAGTKHQSKLL